MIIPVAGGFWNIRGSYKIGGILDVGTHASLVRLSGDRFVFLDSYSLTEPVRRRVNEIVGGGTIEAILNLHPFHTMHVRQMHSLYPDARLYGTSRHLSRFPELPWQKEQTDDPALHALFEKDLEFSVPRGVDFVCADEKVHFSSVLALHRDTRTIHVDDTLVYMRMPLPMRLFGWRDRMTFHPTLARALTRCPGAAGQFRQWAQDLAERWQSAENLCAAHTSVLLARDNLRGPTIKERILSALAKVDKTVAAHERAHG